MSKILVVANQKGGVGKSTISVLLANHLATAGYDVGVIELDVQKSILGKRQVDVQNFGEDELLYQVRYQQPENQQASVDLVNRLKSVEGDSLFIIDLPGRIDDEVLIPFLVYADYLLCPFQYEGMCLRSTTTFLRIVQTLTMRYQTHPQLLFCPNNIDARIGTRKELEGWHKVDKTMAQFGTVIPRLPASADLRRLNTFENTPKQEYLAEPFLKTISSIINVKK